MVICIKQHLSKFEAQFMKKLSKTEAELKKALLIKKNVYMKTLAQKWFNIIMYHK